MLDVMSLMSILHLELHMFAAAAFLIIFLCLRSNSQLRFYCCYAIYVLGTSFVAFILIPIFIFRPRNTSNYILAGIMLKLVSKTVGIHWDLRGKDILLERRGSVLVANHQSIFDVLGFFDKGLILGKCVVVAKKELFYCWPFGLAAWLCGVVFIDRKRAREANMKLEEVSNLISQKQTKMWVYAEGTRNQTGDGLLPFKKGAFRVAIASQAPIIPVVFSPYYFIDGPKKYFGQGRVIIQALKPIPTVGKTMDDVESLMAETRELMLEQFELLKQEVLGLNNNTISHKDKM